MGALAEKAIYQRLFNLATVKNEFSGVTLDNFFNDIGG